MADTTVQRDVADWINGQFLRTKFQSEFAQGRVALSTGGEHRFASVSTCRRIVGSISTSAARTSGGKLGVGKLTKIRADMYFLLLAEADLRFIVFLEPSMVDQMEQERSLGRVPQEIQFFFPTEVPVELLARLRRAQQVAADEMSQG